MADTIGPRPSGTDAEAIAELRQALEERDGEIVSELDANLVREVLGDSAVTGGGSAPYRLSLGTNRKLDLSGLTAAAFGSDDDESGPQAEETELVEAGPDDTAATERKKAKKAKKSKKPKKAGPDKRAAAAISKFTDHRNRLVFVAEQDGEIRWIATSKQWMEWQPPVWARVDESTIMERASAVGQKIHEDAVASGNSLDASRSANAESRGGIAAMVMLSKGSPGVTSTGDEWDAEPNVLNTKSGLLTFPSLHIRPTRKTDMVTTMLPVEVDPEATCPLWDGFLQRVFDGDAEYIAYMQRLAGLCLLGHTSGEHMFFLYGDGANGKSVFVNTIFELLGDDLATTLPATALATRRSTSDEYKLATLPGKRLAVANEVSEGSRLDESLIKNMTGGDRMTVRMINKEPVEFRPTATILMVGNHKPIITGTDGGIWRRVQMVPFTVTIPEEEKDPHLAAKFKAEYPGILWWALQGAAEFARTSKMPPCSVVDRDTQRFRGESDVIAQFVEESCTVDVEASVTFTDLYGVYSEWCRWSNEKPLSKPKFAGAMDRLGFPSKPTTKARLRLGLTLNEHAVKNFVREVF